MTSSILLGELNRAPAGCKAGRAGLRKIALQINLRSCRSVVYSSLKRVDEKDWRNTMLRRAATFVCLLLIAFVFHQKIMARSTQPTAPPEWQTRAEKTNYRETPRYDETVAYARRLDEASPLIRYTTFGQSGEGLPLPLLVAATGNDFTAQAALRAGKAIVMIQACIHAGESDG